MYGRHENRPYSEKPALAIAGTGLMTENIVEYFPSPDPFCRSGKELSDFNCCDKRPFQYHPITRLLCGQSIFARPSAGDYRICSGSGIQISVWLLLLLINRP